jgi:AcrR family transcriptional regulator
VNKAPRPGGKPGVPLTRERVIQAAIALADRQGIAAVSMRALARTLGVQAMSLYNHVTRKDDLIDAMVDAVVGMIKLPVATGGWKEAMRRRAVSARQVFLAHPWAPPLIVSRVNVGPAMLRYIDATLGCLREAGFSYAMADHVWNAIDSHIYGFTLLERNFPLEPTSYAETARRFLPMLPADEYPHMRTLALMVADGEHDGLHDFSFGLGLILDALERRLEGDANA